MYKTLNMLLDYTTLDQLKASSELSTILRSQVVKSIEEAKAKDLPKVNVCNVVNHDLKFFISKKDYNTVLENLLKHYEQVEDFDMCIKIKGML